MLVVVDNRDDEVLVIGLIVVLDDATLLLVGANVVLAKVEGLVVAVD